MPKGTEQQKLKTIGNALTEKVSLWRQRMDYAVTEAKMATVDEKAPWASVVAMASLTGGALTLAAPPVGAAWSVPLNILNTASKVAALNYTNGAKFTNSQMKDLYEKIRSDEHKSNYLKVKAQYTR